MKLFHSIILNALITVNVNAFVSPNNFVLKRSKILCAATTTTTTTNQEVDDLLYRSILKEGGSHSIQSQSSQHSSRGSSSISSRRNSIVLPDSSAAPSALFTSSAAVADPSAATLGNDFGVDAAPTTEGSGSSGGVMGDDLLGSSMEAPPYEGGMPSPEERSGSSSGQMSRDDAMQRYGTLGPKYNMKKFFGIKYTTSKYSFRELVDKKEYNTILLTYMVPLVIAATGVMYGVRALTSRYDTRVTGLYDAYAKEMVYHDGDFEEMQMCHNDYRRRLSVWTTPLFGRSLKSKMISKFLEMYVKKKPVSPQSISSLSYVLTMYKFSEEAAASLLCRVAQSSLKEKLASAGKLLFFGERILKSAGGQKALQPIRDMLISSYRSGGKVILETSQKAMAEAAYRNAVSEGGKEQQSLTVGWEVLGLTQETAERIFNEAAEVDFQSRREIQFKGSAKKYDDKGRRINKDGSLENPSDKDDDGEDDSGSGGDGGSSTKANIYECTECGYTLFPAKGREFKFFSSTFRCPECDCGKDKFKGR